MASLAVNGLNLCRVPKQWHLYGTYISDVTGDLHQIAITCCEHWRLYLHLYNHYKMKLEVLEVNF